MPRRITFVVPPDAVAEELSVEAPADPLPEPSDEARVEELRSVPPARFVDATRQPHPLDLGPNGPAVLELLERAAMLTASERHRLAEIAAWRWWPLTLPVGGASARARAIAIVAARRAGRAPAVAWLDKAGPAAKLGRRADQLLVRAVGNAALALLVRDLVTDEVFEALYGPWREVTHR